MADAEARNEFNRANLQAVREKLDALAGQPKATAGAENALGKKLNGRRVPTIARFDQKGLLIATGLRANHLGAEVKRLLNPEPADDGRNGKRRR